MKTAAVAAAALLLGLVACSRSAPPAAALTPSATLGQAPLPAAPSGTSGPAVVFPVGDMRAQLASYIAAAKAKGSAGATLENYGSYRLQLSVRARSSDAVADAHWDEVMIVEQGSAVLITGGRIIGGQTNAEGETVGIRIEGGQRQGIAAGDILTVRAGTPHQLMLAPGTVCSAFVIRIHER